MTFIFNVVPERMFSPGFASLGYISGWKRLVWKVSFALYDLHLYVVVSYTGRRVFLAKLFWTWLLIRALWRKHILVKDPSLPAKVEAAFCLLLVMSPTCLCWSNLPFGWCEHTMRKLTSWASFVLCWVSSPPPPLDLLTVRKENVFKWGSKQTCI